MSKNLQDYFGQEARQFSGHFGLAAQRIDGGDSILYRADEIFPTASVIKLVIVAEYLAQVDSGRLVASQPVTIKAEDWVGGSGVLKDLQPGVQLTLHDLATLSITVSDNIAANLLIQQVGGLVQINARLQTLDMPNTTMGRPFIFDSTADNTGSPADFLGLLLKIGRQELITSTISRQLFDLMRRQQYKEYIPRYLPYHPFAAEYGLAQSLTIANKVGMLPGTVNDAALITSPEFSYALVIFSRDCRDKRADPENEGGVLLARLAKQIFAYYS